MCVNTAVPGGEVTALCRWQNCVSLQPGSGALSVEEAVQQSRASASASEEIDKCEDKADLLRQRMVTERSLQAGEAWSPGCPLTSVLPPAVLSLLLPYLDLASLLRLEQTCRLLREVVLASAEYGRRARRLAPGTPGGRPQL